MSFDKTPLALAFSLPQFSTRRLRRPTAACDQAQQAEELRDYDLAVARYTKILRAKPDDRDALAGLDRSKLRAAEAHLLRGRRLEATRQVRRSRSWNSQLASELNPTNGDVARELRATRLALRNTVERSTRTARRLDAVLARTRAAVPASLNVPETRLPASIKLGPRRPRSVRRIRSSRSSRSSASCSTRRCRDTIAQIDLKNLTVKEALDALARTTQTFYKVTAPGTITVVPDTAGEAPRIHGGNDPVVLHRQRRSQRNDGHAARRRRRALRLASSPDRTRSSMRDTPERMQAVRRLLAAFDKARPEVVIDVEIIEVDRNAPARIRPADRLARIRRARRLGRRQHATALTLRTLRNLSQSDALISGLPALYYRLLKTDTSTRTLANPHLRASTASRPAPSSASACRCRRRRSRRSRTGGVNAAADHAVHLREHRREHRHHAAHAPE